MEQQFFNNMSEKVVDDLRKTVVAGSRLSIAAASFSLLSILNSNIAKLWIWYNCPELMGGTREIRKVYFENFRIPLENTEILSQLAALADEIIAAKSSLSQPKGTEPVIASDSEVEESQNRIADFKKQVNALVYQLYGVTDAEEIEAVEKR